jgi:hypothetical protein
MKYLLLTLAKILNTSYEVLSQWFDKEKLDKIILLHICHIYGKYSINSPHFIGMNTAPTVTSTSPATSIAQTTATASGNITATGGENPSTRGVCYVVGTGTPTIADTVNSESGSFGTGAFSRNLTGLTAGTLYTFRAFATNSLGTGYGDNVQFTTQANNPPTVALNSPANEATDIALTPTLEFTGTDSNNDSIRYNVQVLDTLEAGNAQLVQQSSNTGTGDQPTVTLGNTPTQNNLLVAFVGSAQNFALTAVSSGWTALTGLNTGAGGSQVSARVFYKIAGSSESTTFTAQSSGSNGWNASILEYRGINITTPLNAENIQVTASGTTHATPNVASSGAGAGLIVAMAFARVNTTTFSGQQINSSSTGVTEQLDFGGTNASTTVYDRHIGSLSGSYQGQATSATSAVGAGALVIFNVDATTPVIDAVSGTDSGFANIDTPADTDPFNSGDRIGYTVQSDLDTTTEYFWRVRGIDPSGSNTYGAWSSTRSFTTGAGSAETKTHTINVFSRNLEDRTHTINSFVKDTQTNTHTVNSYTAERLSESHTLNSLIKATQTSTHTFDVISISTDTQTHTIDIAVKSLETDTYTIDNLTFEQNTDTHTTNTLVKESKTDTHSTNSLVKEQITDTHTVDVYVNDSTTQTHTVDTLIKETGTDTHTLNALIKSENTNTHDVDSLSKEVLTDDHNINSLTKERLEESHTVNSLIQEQATKTHSIDFDSYEFGEETKSHTLNVLVKESVTDTHTIDSQTKEQLTESYSVDNLVKESLTATHTINNLTKEVLDSTHTVDINVYEAGQETKTYTVDVNVYIPSSTFVVKLRGKCKLRGNIKIR